MKTERKIGTSLRTLLVCLIAPLLISCHVNQSGIMDAPIDFNHLPVRKGNRPSTTDTNPHTQLNQQPEDLSFVHKLMNWAFALANINKRPSAISVPGAIAMWMEDAHACDACNAFMVGTEFAHFHPQPDYSLHLGLPKHDAEKMIENGWGEWHPMIKRGILPPNIVMLYAPRSHAEMEVAKVILERSYQFAKGQVK